MLDRGDTFRVHKTRHRVSVTLHDGTVLSGFMFLGARERLLDVFNDSRSFVPILTADERLIFLAKTSIALAEPIPETTVERASDYDGDNPYAILGVAQGADEATLKSAYHDLMRAFHPDQVVAAGLSAGLVKLAEQRVQRINEAYRLLVRAP